MPEIRKVGVIGAGTMGAGIAQLSLAAGATTVLLETVDAARERGIASIEAGLEKMVSRGKLSAEQAASTLARLEPASGVDALLECDLVIEAVPELLDLKIELLRTVAAVVRDDCLLATNTSSLSVSAIASQLPHPERVVGMHFFNPPPIMKLLEVIPTDATEPAALQSVLDFGAAMGKTTIVAADLPGFIVNRYARPFGLEAMRLIQDDVAEASTIDVLCRDEAGFRMGPLELLDLVGLDVSVDVARSFYEQSFGEPRWRPSMIAARLVAAGRLGRKTGHGFYRYPIQEAEKEVPRSLSATIGSVAIVGDSTLASQLRDAAASVGWRLDGERPDLVVDCGMQPSTYTLNDTPRLTLCIQSLAERDPYAVGFHAIAPLPKGGAIELTATSLTDQAWVDAAVNFVSSIGSRSVWVRDAPGLVVGRIVCQLINEAAFGSTVGIGSRADIDTGAKLGVNHPRGPFEWLEEVGAETVLGVLDALHEEYGEERYRAAPLLRTAVSVGALPEERKEV